MVLPGLLALLSVILRIIRISFDVRYIENHKNKANKIIDMVLSGHKSFVDANIDSPKIKAKKDY